MAMPAGATTRQTSAKRPIYNGFFGILLIWCRSRIPVFSVSFCPADKIFASAPQTLCGVMFFRVDNFPLPGASKLDLRKVKELAQKFSTTDGHG
jgi:hypothetical protein